MAHVQNMKIFKLFRKYFLIVFLSDSYKFANVRYIAELVDVSSFGSFISVIHGSSGEYIANRTNSVTNLYQQLRNNTRPSNI